MFNINIDHLSSIPRIINISGFHTEDLDGFISVHYYGNMDSSRICSDVDIWMFVVQILTSPLELTDQHPSLTAWFVV